MPRHPDVCLFLNCEFRFIISSVWQFLQILPVVNVYGFKYLFSVFNFFPKFLICTIGTGVFSRYDRYSTSFIMKNMLIAGFVLAGLLGLFNACKNDKKDASTTQSVDANATYVCPMHPDVAGKAGDKCSKCGMALEPAKSNANQAYKMSFSTNPATIEAGKAGTLSFKPEIVGMANTPVPLDLHHEKKIHLIAVSKDLSWFDHIHPEYQADGSFQIKLLEKATNFTDGRGKNETKFEQGGDYVLFADYMPTGASGQLERIPLSIGGTPYKPVTYTKEKLSSTVDGYTVTLKPGGGKFVTNNTLHIEGTVTQGGKAVPAESFENYLGAKAHVVMIHAGAEHYMHVHPDVEGGKLDLHATFEETGIYRGWLQFQTGGKVHTADFVINVTAGMPGENGHEGHDHGAEHKAEGEHAKH